MNVSNTCIADTDSNDGPVLNFSNLTLESAVELVCPCECNRPLQLFKTKNGTYVIGRVDCVKCYLTYGKDAGEVLDLLLTKPIPVFDPKQHQNNNTSKE